MAQTTETLECAEGTLKLTRENGKLLKVSYSLYNAPELPRSFNDFDSCRHCGTWLDDLDCDLLGSQRCAYSPDDNHKLFS